MSRRNSVFCAFCKLKFSTYSQKHIGIWTLFGCVLITAVLNFYVFTDFHWAMALVTVAFVLIAEAFIRIRWRTSICCPHCHFDPILYKKSPDQAALRVKVFLDHRKTNPYYLLRPTPQLPVIKMKKNKQNQMVRSDSGRSLSEPKKTSLRI